MFISRRNLLRIHKGMDSAQLDQFLYNVARSIRVRHPVRIPLHCGKAGWVID